jgi:hypothetical protein
MVTEFSNDPQQGAAAEFDFTDLAFVAPAVGTCQRDATSPNYCGKWLQSCSSILGQWDVVTVFQFSGEPDEDTGLVWLPPFFLYFLLCVCVFCLLLLLLGKKFEFFWGAHGWHHMTWLGRAMACWPSP